MWNKGRIAPKCTSSTKLTGVEIKYPRNTEAVHQSYVSNGMIDAWEDHVDEEGCECMLFQHRQKLPSIVQPQKQKTKGKKWYTASDWMKDKIIEDLQANQPSIFNKVKGGLNPFWILHDNQSIVQVF